MEHRRRLLIEKTQNNRLYLYNYGDECVEITGGWRIGGYTRGTNTKFEKRSNHLYLYSGASKNSTLSCATQNQIDLSGYKTIHFLVDTVANTQSRNNRVQVSQNFSTATDSTTAFTIFNGQELRELVNAEKYEVVLNIEKMISAGVLYLDKLGYPSVVCDTWNSSNIKDGYIKLYQCWLEK